MRGAQIARASILLHSNTISKKNFSQSLLTILPWTPKTQPLLHHHSDPAFSLRSPDTTSTSQGAQSWTERRSGAVGGRKTGRKEGMISKQLAC